MNDQIDTLLSEQRRFPPPPEFAARAAATEALYEAGRDWKKFWEQQARELEWIAPWNRVLEWKLPHARWFVGGKLNASANCLDRHLNGPRRNKAAIIWEGEPGERRVLTYWDLAREVCRCANALKGSRHPARRPGGDLPPDDPRGSDGDARLRPDRRGAFGGIRRVLRRVPARPDQRCASSCTHHRRRRISPGTGAPAQAVRRRRPGPVPFDQALHRGPASRRRIGSADEGRAGPLVARGCIQERVAPK